MSDLRSMAIAVRAVRTGFDTANPGMPPAIELRDPPNLRHYAPHPEAPSVHDEPDDVPGEFDDPRDYERFGEEQQGYHGDRR